MSPSWPNLSLPVYPDLTAAEIRLSLDDVVRDLLAEAGRNANVIRPMDDYQPCLLGTDEKDNTVYLVGMYSFHAKDALTGQDVVIEATLVVPRSFPKDRSLKLTVMTVSLPKGPGGGMSRVGPMRPHDAANALKALRPLLTELKAEPEPPL
jgi:hypothetical protein